MIFRFTLALITFFSLSVFASEDHTTGAAGASNGQQESMPVANQNPGQTNSIDSVNIAIDGEVQRSGSSSSCEWSMGTFEGSSGGPWGNF